jgi:uroporphyrinogen-III decarboxylase
MKNPRGIRNVEEWYISTVSRKDYVYRVFERQCEIALENLSRLYRAVGSRIDILFISGTDFGMQTGPFISPKTYRQLYKPFQKQLNDWVHKNTPWKCFIHSCGSIAALMPDMIEAGFDIFNPVQTSATGMEAGELKAKFGDRIVFWGGGIDTQHTLPFGSPEEVREQVRGRMRIFGQGGGFVFNSIHNIQAGIPVENLIALYQAVHDSREIANA